MFIFAPGSRRSSWNGPGLKGERTLIAMSPNSTIFFRNLTVASWYGTEEIEALFVAGRSEKLTWEDVAQDFEYLLTQFLSPHIVRIRYAD